MKLILSKEFFVCLIKMIYLVFIFWHETCPKLATDKEKREEKEEGRSEKGERRRETGRKGKGREGKARQGEPGNMTFPWAFFTCFQAGVFF